MSPECVDKQHVCHDYFITLFIYIYIYLIYLYLTLFYNVDIVFTAPKWLKSINTALIVTVFTPENDLSNYSTTTMSECYKIKEFIIVLTIFYIHFV